MGQSETSLRILVLALNLINTRSGRTRDELQSLVQGYEALSDDTFQRTFERDIAALREAGFQVLVSSNPARYLVERKLLAPSSVELTSAEVDLLLQAAAAWESLSPAELSRLSLKLAGLTNSQVPGQPTIFHRLEGVEHLPQILEAIGQRQPIRFRYSSRRGVADRDVAPLGLMVRGPAVYLWGHDLNREGERYFRLSRIDGKIELVGEPNFYELPAEGPRDFAGDNFRIRPELWIRQGASPLVRLRCESVADSDESRPGWDRCRGRAADWESWERLIVSHCEDVVVEEPTQLAESIYRKLQAAAGEGAPWKTKP
ncbi:WYL domain-containing protein [Scrofimicrobium sp. R131]|uniref:WYL domain-containing protein n=1 Tax=Scrofimicrobium appendicitidis TaxID=3079930 RepID=A0AAU7V501_9ACTO